MHCCDEMNRHVVIASKEGVDPYDSSDQVIVYSDKFDEYGLIIRDGGTSSYEITFCPFCGSKLPESKRDRWFEELEKLGHENPFDDESIPNAYKSSDWFRRT